MELCYRWVTVGKRVYFMIRDGMKERFYEVKVSAKKFSAQMVGVRDKELPEAVRVALRR